MTFRTYNKQPIRPIELGIVGNKKLNNKEKLNKYGNG